MWIIKININRGWSPWCIEYKWTKKLNDFLHNKDDQNSKSKWPRITGFCYNKLILYSPLSNSISDCMMFASASILAQASSLHTVPTRMITSSTQSSSQAPVKVRSSYIIVHIQLIKCDEVIGQGQKLNVLREVKGQKWILPPGNMNQGQMSKSKVDSTDRIIARTWF